VLSWPPSARIYLAAGANEHDKWLAGPTLLSRPVLGPEPTAGRPTHFCADKGYDYADVWEVAGPWGFTPHIKGPRRGGGGEGRDPRPSGSALGRGADA
jgi:hypothetical protein